MRTMTDPARRRRRRPHPARGARIAATGLGVTGVLGLTATFAGSAAAGDASPEPVAAGLPGDMVPSTVVLSEPAPAPPIPLTPVPVRRRVVVVAPRSGGGAPGSPGSASSGSTAAAPRSSSAAPRPATRRPAPQRVAPSPPAPAARSGGSR